MFDITLAANCQSLQAYSSKTYTGKRKSIAVRNVIYQNLVHWDVTVQILEQILQRFQAVCKTNMENLQFERELVLDCKRLSTDPLYLAPIVENCINKRYRTWSKLTL